MREQIASAINLIVQVDRLPGGPRRVTSITEITGREKDVITMQELFRFRQLGVERDRQSPTASSRATGIRPYFMPRLQAASIELPAELFQERTLLKA